MCDKTKTNAETNLRKFPYSVNTENLNIEKIPTQTSQCSEHIFVSKFTNKSSKANDRAKKQLKESQNLGKNAFFDKCIINIGENE